MEEGLSHDKHIQDVKFPPAHDRGKSIGVSWVFFCNNPFCLIQVFFEMGVFVLAAYRLNIVVSLFWKDNVVLSEKSLVVFPVKNGLFLLFHVLCMDFPAEVSPVMAEAYIITVQVFPCPVEAGELTVIRIFRRYVIPCVIWCITKGRLAFGAYLQGKVHIIRGHPVGFMSSNENFDIHEYVERRVKREE